MNVPGPSGAPGNIATNFPLGPARDKLVNAIVGSCTYFAPPLPNWQLYCEAIVASAIVSESTYTPNSVVNDSYSVMNGGGNDPTVGLIQIRFSSTVHDYNYYGPIPKITAVGCAWPPALTALGSNDPSWKNGGTNYLTFMEDPSCNVPLATWYYFYNATGNGAPTSAGVKYIAQYCQGTGIAGNVIMGLMSHLQGPGFARNADGANPPIEMNRYPVGIKYRFMNLLGALPTPDPFTVPLAPMPTQYCK